MPPEIAQAELGEAGKGRQSTQSGGGQRRVSFVARAAPASRQGIIVPVSMKRWCQESASPGSDGDCSP